MAKTAPGPASAPSGGDDFDYSKFLPPDVKVSDLVEYDSLTPIYSAEIALSEGWDPVVGWCYGTEVLPEQRPGTPTAFTPIMIRVCLTHPTKAETGAKDARKIVELKAGEDILVPVNKGMALNKKLENAITDAKQVPLMIFRVAGTIKTSQAQPMWDWDVRDTQKRQARTGKFALPGNEIVLFDLTTRLLTTDGSVVNGQTGEVLKTGIPIGAGAGA